MADSSLYVTHEWDNGATTGTWQGITRSTEPMWRVIPAPPPATQEQYHALWNRVAQTVTFSGTSMSNQGYRISSEPGGYVKWGLIDPVYDPFNDPLMRLPEGM